MMAKMSHGYLMLCMMHLCPPCACVTWNIRFTNDTSIFSTHVRTSNMLNYSSQFMFLYMERCWQFFDTKHLQYVWFPCENFVFYLGYKSLHIDNTWMDHSRCNIVRKWQGMWLMIMIFFSWYIMGEFERMLWFHIWKVDWEIIWYFDEKC